MIKTLFIFLLLFIVCVPSYSQSKEIENNPCDCFRDEMKQYSNSLFEKYEELDCYNPNIDPIVIPFVKATYEGHFIKEDFLNHTFLKNIKPFYYIYSDSPEGKEYQNLFFTYVCDSTGKILADGCGLVDLCCWDSKLHDSVNSLQNMVSTIFELKVNCLFQITMSGGIYYFGISENNIWVLVSQIEGFEILSIPDFIELHWDNFALMRKR